MDTLERIVSLDVFGNTVMADMIIVITGMIAQSIEHVTGLKVGKYFFARKWQHCAGFNLFELYFRKWSFTT